MNTANFHELSNDLTPQQASDVIGYYDAAENPHGNRYRKATLGVVAAHAAAPKHSILPVRLGEDSPRALLTYSEAAVGLDFIQSPESTTIDQWPIEPTEDQWQQIEALHDKAALPIDEAYARIMGVKPRHWR